MRFLGVLLAVVALAGACAESRREPASGDSAEMIRRIDGFVARQRAADAAACADEGLATGTSAHLLCVKDRAARRRAAIQGHAHDRLNRAPQPAGWCWNEAAGRALRCVEI